MKQAMEQARASITDLRYDLIDPKVQQYGDAALLTYNLTNYGKLSGGPESVLSRWNCSQMYARAGGTFEARPQPLVVHQIGAENVEAVASHSLAGRRVDSSEA
jgi:hypothetical protein